MNAFNLLFSAFFVFMAALFLLIEAFRSLRAPQEPKPPKMRLIKAWGYAVGTKVSFSVKIENLEGRNGIYQVYLENDWGVRAYLNSDGLDRIDSWFPGTSLTWTFPATLSETGSELTDSGLSCFIDEACRFFLNVRLNGEPYFGQDITEQFHEYIEDLSVNKHIRSWDSRLESAIERHLYDYELEKAYGLKHERNNRST